MGSKILAVSICLLCCAFLGVSSAQEEPRGNVDYSYGTVLSVDSQSGMITVSEYDWDTDGEIKVAYSVDPKVRVENFSSWKDIPVDSYVDIEYVTNANGKKVIMAISVYES